MGVLFSYLLCGNGSEGGAIYMSSPGCPSCQEHAKLRLRIPAQLSAWTLLLSIYGTVGGLVSQQDVNTSGSSAIKREAESQEQR